MRQRGENCDSTQAGGEIWQLRRNKNGVWGWASFCMGDSVQKSVLGGGQQGGWTGKEEDERSEKRKGLDYCLLPSARTDEELGSLAVCDLSLTRKALHRIKIKK